MRILKKIAEKVGAFFRPLRSHDLFNLSANTAFFAVLSLFPMLMIFISGLGYFMGSEDVLAQIMGTLTDVIPGARELLHSNIENLVNNKSTIGWSGIAILLVIATMLFGSMETAFDRIFESEKKRNFFHSRLLAVGVIFIILVLLFLPASLRLLESIFARYGHAIPLSSYLSGRAFFVIFAVLSFVVIVKIVPNERIFIRYAFVGGGVYALGIAAAKYLFHWYILMAFDRYNLIYGSLTAIVLSVIWIYYLVVVLYLSAEVTAYLQRRSSKQFNTPL